MIQELLKIYFFKMEEEELSILNNEEGPLIVEHILSATIIRTCYTRLRRTELRKWKSIISGLLHRTFSITINC